MVAGLALCLDWLPDLRWIYRFDWKNWSNIPHSFPCCKQSFFWNLGQFMAGVQSCWHGMCLVRRTSLDRRYLLWFVDVDRSHSCPNLGECITLMLRAIWPQYNNLPNSLPLSSGTNTRDFLSFFLFWFCSLPAIWFPVHKIRHLFTVKAFYVPCAGVAFFIWAIVKAKGIGPIVHQPNSIHGTDLAWAIIKGIMSSIANFATLIVNDPDFARFAQKPKDALWSQVMYFLRTYSSTTFLTQRPAFNYTHWIRLYIIHRNHCIFFLYHHI